MGKTFLSSNTKLNQLKNHPQFLCFLMLDVYGIQRNPIILYLRTGLDEEQKAETHQMPLREYSHEKANVDCKLYTWNPFSLAVRYA